MRKWNGPAGGTLGEDPETGETISMEAGPFGMYIKAVRDGVKTRSAPLAKLQPEEVNLNVALDLLSYPKALGRHPESDEIVELRRASSTGKIRVGCGADCAYLPKVSLSAHLIVAVPDLLLAGLGRKMQSAQQDIMPPVEIWYTQPLKFWGIPKAATAIADERSHHEILWHLSMRLTSALVVLRHVIVHRARRAGALSQRS